MKTLVIMPTYNERENIEAVLRAIFEGAHDDALSVLVVDDSSPDGTGGIVRSMMQQLPHGRRLYLLSRGRKDGIAGAYIAGFRWGLEQGFDLFVQMDADLSHDPAFLPRLIGAASRFDFVVGSRYVPGGGVDDWSVVRRLISRGGSLFARMVLGSSIHDLTGGFNAWNREVFRRVNLAECISAGYSFQIELKHRAAQAHLTWMEIPITFKDRIYGSSKMSGRIVLEAVRNVLVLRRRVKSG